MTTPICAGNGNIRVVDWLALELRRHGVDFVFGVDGANIEDLYDAVHYTPGIQAIVAKHEFSAGTMADGYARATSRMSVVATTSGGGAVNLVPALAESYASRVPVLAIVGQPPRPLEGNGAFQDGSGRAGSMDLQAVFRPVSGHCARVERPEEIAEALAHALAAMRDDLPAVLLIPKDVQQAHLTAVPPPQGRPERRPAVPAQLADFAQHLADTPGRILVVAGPEVARHDARGELSDLVDRLDAFVAVSPDAKDAVDGEDPRLLGVIGVMGHPAVEKVLRHGVTCVCIGTTMPVMTRGGVDFSETPVLSIGSVTPHIESRHLQTENLASTLARLAAVLPTRVDAPDSETLYAPAHLEPPAHDGGGVRYHDGMHVLDRVIPDDADIFVDAGNTGAAAVHYVGARRRGRYVVALGMGGMGYAFGAGIGCAFARGGRTVVIAGDGAFFMHGMEIHTAIEHRLPVTFVIVNNNAHAMCVTREQLYYGGNYSFNRFAPSHIASGLGAMFPGLMCHSAETVADFEAAMHDAMAHSGPAVVEVICSTDEIPPFAPFLSSEIAKEKTHDRHDFRNHQSLARA
ncbi:thiamine pyrophosphate-binding protein [Mycobacteroides saopaulense]|uniref:acetolactate synthase n=1 Tax=Mycobacteroides saopaulense TaxID=1578165 RepID=A0ABX3BX68_9MYCO|nr:acetolactate synthase [Mycobacteroides saopaulense]OHU08333.1 acetolactate synthase [Mycobacteroides saopaulense]